jgi:N-methylhydantoinase A
VQEDKRTRRAATHALKGKRGVYFGALNDHIPTDLYDGDKLKHGMIVYGPAVVEQENTTVVIFPGQTLRVNRFGDYLLQL